MRNALPTKAATTIALALALAAALSVQAVAPTAAGAGETPCVPRAGGDECIPDDDPDGIISISLGARRIIDGYSVSSMTSSTVPLCSGSARPCLTTSPISPNLWLVGSESGEAQNWGSRGDRVCEPAGQEGLACTWTVLDSDVEQFGGTLDTIAVWAGASYANDEGNAASSRVLGTPLAPTGVEFDWEVRQRLQRPEAGVLPDLATTPEAVQHTSYPVDLTVLDPSRCDDGVTWVVDGAAVAAAQTGQCTWAIDFADEGSRSVQLTGSFTFPDS